MVLIVSDAFCTFVTEEQADELESEGLIEWHAECGWFVLPVSVTWKEVEDCIGIELSPEEENVPALTE